MLALDRGFTLSFASGLVAAVNPCGFVLLPTYLLYFLGLNGTSPGSQQATVRRALTVSAALSGGFLAVFLVIGVISRVFTNFLYEHAKYAALVIGLALIVLGVAMLLGYRLPIATPKLRAGGGDRTVRSMFLYGVAYAVASIGCALAPFTATVLGTVSRSGFADGITAIALYGLGMTLVVTALTVTLAVAQTTVLCALRAGMRYVERASAVLVLLSGMFLTWYWLSDIRGSSTSSWVSNVQARVENWIDTHRSLVGWTVSLVVVAAVLFLVVRRQTGGGRQATDPTPVQPELTATPGGER